MSSAALKNNAYSFSFFYAILIIEKWEIKWQKVDGKSPPTWKIVESLEWEWKFMHIDEGEPIKNQPLYHKMNFFCAQHKKDATTKTTHKRIEHK